MKPLILTNGLRQLARLFAVRADQAEDALHNERSAKLALSRRSFLGVGAALAGGVTFGFYRKLDHLPWNDPGSVYISLDGLGPTPYGDQYKSYGRVAIARNKDNWDISPDAVANCKHAITFPESTGEELLAVTLTIWGADGHPRFVGEVDPPIPIRSRVIPQLMSLKVTGGPEPERQWHTRALAGAVSA